MLQNQDNKQPISLGVYDFIRLKDNSQYKGKLNVTTIKDGVIIARAEDYVTYEYGSSSSRILERGCNTLIAVDQLIVALASANTYNFEA